jgi:hypothetical protein
MRTTAITLIAFTLGVVMSLVVGARADDPPAFDRHLAEALVRAEEQQASALNEIRAQMRSEERQASALDDIRRAIERCNK